MQKKSRNSRGKKRAMETHFYTMEFFCPFTRIFLYTSRKIPYNFFLCCVRISRVMKAKKSRNSRGKTRAMKIHFYAGIIFSFTRSLSYEHTEKINETALGSHSKNVASEMETICKYIGSLAVVKELSWSRFERCACAHTDVSMGPNSHGVYIPTPG